MSAIEAFIASRRLTHTANHSLNSGCCRNCDVTLRESAKCFRCGVPYAKWRTAYCIDREADAALAEVAAGREAIVAARGET